MFMNFQTKHDKTILGIFGDQMRSVAERFFDIGVLMCCHAARIFLRLRSRFDRRSMAARLMFGPAAPLGASWCCYVIDVPQQWKSNTTSQRLVVSSNMINSATWDDTDVTQTVLHMFHHSWLARDQWLRGLETCWNQQPQWPDSQVITFVVLSGALPFFNSILHKLLLGAWNEHGLETTPPCR